jgi:hypothetical protein
LNAPILTLEHRYFGTSFPDNSSTENYAKYLNVPQVLADLANFAQKIPSQYPELVGAKWLAVGGSYSGLFSSFFREVYPNVFHAAISSSGVVLADDNYSNFDLQVGIAMGQECASVARSVRVELENLWEQGHKPWILKQFGCEGLLKTDDFWLVWAISLRLVRNIHSAVDCVIPWLIL